MPRKLFPSDIDDIAPLLLGKHTSKDGVETRYGRKGSLKTNSELGTFYDFESGHGGGMIDLVIHCGEAADRHEAWRWLVSALDLEVEHHHHVQVSTPAKCETGAEYRARILNGSRSVEGTVGETYLRSRAIPPRYPAALRYHPRIYNREAGVSFCALISVVTPLDSPDVVRALQRTWLTPGGVKANLLSPKKTVGQTSNGGVILAPFTDAIVVGEGVETTLSASLAIGLPGVATLGTSGMAKLHVPPRVRNVIIAFDRDASGAGLYAAERLAQRLWANGHKVQLAAPPLQFADWNDAAIAGASHD